MKIEIETYADDVPLNGPGRPKVERADDLLRLLATVRHRFGNTAITFNGTWGSNALWAMDSLSEDVDRLKALIYSLAPHFREPTPDDDPREGETEKEHHDRLFPIDSSSKWPVSIERIISMTQMRNEFDRAKAEFEWQEYQKQRQSTGP